MVCFCIVYIVYCCLLLNSFFYDLLQDCAEDGDGDVREGFNLSFDLELVAFYLQTKNVSIVSYHM